jgi:hypothetical protein
MAKCQTVACDRLLQRYKPNGDGDMATSYIIDVAGHPTNPTYEIPDRVGANSAGDLYSFIDVRHYNEKFILLIK